MQKTVQPEECLDETWPTGMKEELIIDPKKWTESMEKELLRKALVEEAKKKDIRRRLEIIEQKLNILDNIKKDLQELKGICEEMIEIKQMTYPFTISGKKYILDTIIEKEGEEYVAFIPDLDLASQGNTAIDALQSLKELTEFYFENEDKEFVKKKLKNIVTK